MKQFTISNYPQAVKAMMETQPVLDVTAQQPGLFEYLNFRLPEARDGIKQKTGISLIWTKTKNISDKVTLTLAKLYISISKTTADSILDPVFPSATFWLN